MNTTVLVNGRILVRRRPIRLSRKLVRFMRKKIWRQHFSYFHLDWQSHESINFLCLEKKRAKNQNQDSIIALRIPSTSDLIITGRKTCTICRMIRFSKAYVMLHLWTGALWWRSSTTRRKFLPNRRTWSVKEWCRIWTIDCSVTC